jgi:hypothetical protein
MTVLRLNVFARLEREFQLEAVKRALWTREHDGIEPEPPEGVSLPRWRAMLKHATKCRTVGGLLT